MTARGSATESAALLDAIHRVGLLETAKQDTGKEMLVRIVSMLVRLARNLESASMVATAATVAPSEQNQS